MPCGSDDSVASIWSLLLRASKDRDQLGGSGGVFTLVFCETTFDQLIRCLSLALPAGMPVCGLNFLEFLGWCDLA